MANQVRGGWVYCHSCGEGIPEDSRFCRWCGANQGERENRDDDPKVEATPKASKRLVVIIIVAVLMASILSTVVAVHFLLRMEEDIREAEDKVSITHLTARYGEEDAHFDVYFTTHEDIMVEDLSVEVTLKRFETIIGTASRPSTGSGMMMRGDNGVFKDIKIKHQDERKDLLGAEVTIYYRGERAGGAGYINLPW